MEQKTYMCACNLSYIYRFIQINYPVQRRNTQL